VRRRPPSKGSGGEVEQVRRPESKQDRLARTAGQAFVAEMPDREGERRFVDEENRQIAGATIAVAILALRSSSLHVRARESAILDFTCPSIAIFKGRPCAIGSSFRPHPARLSSTLAAWKNSLSSIDPNDAPRVKLVRETIAYYERELAHFRALSVR
jgi:hypothetical protein